MTEITRASNSISLSEFHVSEREPISATATNVAMAPPTRPSTVLPGLTHSRTGVRPIEDPIINAPTSLATTPATIKNNVSVPIEDGSAAFVEYLKINAAKDPRSPIQTTAIDVIAVLGIGPLCTPCAPTKPIEIAINANVTTNGNAASPIQYAANGAEIHAASPARVAGLYPFSVTLPKNSTPASPNIAVTMRSTATGRHITAIINAANRINPVVTAVGMSRPDTPPPEVFLRALP